MAYGCRQKDACGREIGRLQFGLDPGSHVVKIRAIVKQVQLGLISLRVQALLNEVKKTSGKELK